MQKVLEGVDRGAEAEVDGCQEPGWAGRGGGGLCVFNSSARFGVAAHRAAAVPTWEHDALSFGSPPKPAPWLSARE